MALRILMHKDFPEGDVAAARDAAIEYDPAAEVSATYEAKAIDPVLAVLIFVSGSYFDGLVGAMAADHYDKLKGSVRRMRATLRTRSQLVIEDDAGLQIVLGPMTPVEALDHLPIDVRNAAGESGQLHWDDETQSWKSPF